MTDRIPIRLRARETSVCVEAATRAGITLSSFIRSAALVRAGVEAGKTASATVSLRRPQSGRPIRLPVAMTGEQRKAIEAAAEKARARVDEWIILAAVEAAAADLEASGIRPEAAEAARVAASAVYQRIAIRNEAAAAIARSRGPEVAS